MRVTNCVAIVAVTLLSLAGLNATPSVAQASTTTAATCSVKTVGNKNTAGAADSRFTLNADHTVTSTFVVSGTDCTATVTIASWKAPDASKGRPYSAQTLFAHTTDTFSTGTHTISVALPDCYYQVDLVTGSNPTAADGGAVYDTSVMRGSLHGGTKTCTPPTVPPELPKTGNGSSVFLLGATVATLGYATSLLRKKFTAQQ
jgi:LPXTG-motif cell wall-anchored protein